jgi:CRP/FNR family transcriptional regulator, cyclic AMP receptor protein
MEGGMDQKARLLAQVPLFSHLGKRGLEQMARLADEVDVREGTVLTREGRSGGEFFVILEGTVEVTRDGKALRTLGAGEFLGEIALLDDGPRTATATATSPARLLVLAHREFHSMLDGDAEIRSEVLLALARRLRDLDPQHEH